MTVSKAYALLEMEGVVVRRPGLPLVVSDRSVAAADAARQEQLRAVMAPAAAAARLLGVTDEEAVEAFREALNEAKHEEQEA